MYVTTYELEITLTVILISINTCIAGPVWVVVGPALNTVM